MLVIFQKPNLLDITLLAFPAFAGAISDIYAGTAIPDAPTPNPPRNRKIANVYGSFANADPTAETVYKTPTHKSVFFFQIFVLV